MNKRINRTQRNYIIVGLCAILVIMAVGYAAFSSQLKISGTSNIANNFIVKITDIQSTVQSGGASDAVVPSYTDTTATFHTNLVSPGDSMKYEVTIENKGSIDAVLKTITKTDTSNSAILFETTGVNEGDELKAGESTTMIVTVTYNPAVTSQPTDLESNLTVELDYEQTGGGSVEPGPGGNITTIGGQEVEIVSSGDGLYEDSYESGRLIYRGQNPNNYIEFNDELWRIIAKEADGTYKIIRDRITMNGFLEGKRAFDEINHRSTAKNSYCQDPLYGCGVYAAVSGEFSSPSGSQKGTVTEDSSIKIYLNDDYYVNNINSAAKEQMTSHSFNIGAVEYLDQSGAEADSIAKNIAGEKMYKWTGNVGLVNVSDILRASTNSLCTSATTSVNGSNECNSNYLLDSGTESFLSLYYWTINAYSSESGDVSFITWYGFADSTSRAVFSSRSHYIFSPRPVVFLKSDTTLSGEGTINSPFTIV